VFILKKDKVVSIDTFTEVLILNNLTALICTKIVQIVLSHASGRNTGFTLKVLENKKRSEMLAR
jgi:hypothetical protein